MEDTLSKLEVAIAAVAAGNQFVNMTASYANSTEWDDLDSDPFVTDDEYDHMVHLATVLHLLHTTVGKGNAHSVLTAAERPQRMRRAPVRLHDALDQAADLRAQQVVARHALSHTPDVQQRARRKPPAQVMGPNDQDAQRDMRMRNVPAGFEPALL